MEQNIVVVKKSKLALISLIIGALWVVGLVAGISGVLGSSTDSASQAGAAIATAIAFPHILCTFIAVIFNALGYFMSKRGFVLTGAILYAVAMVLLPLYFLGVIIPMILSFVAYGKYKT